MDPDVCGRRHFSAVDLKTVIFKETIEWAEPPDESESELKVEDPESPPPYKRHSNGFRLNFRFFIVLQRVGVQHQTCISTDG